MTNDLNLGIRLTADGKGFVGEVRVSRQELDKLTGSTQRGQRTNRDYSRASKNVERQTRKTGKSFLDAHGRIAKYAQGLASVAVVAQSVRGLSRAADTYKGLNNAIRLTVESESELIGVRQRLFDISQRVRTPIAQTAQLYSRLALSQEALGASTGDLLRVIEGVGQALVINGSSAASASGALLQLSQALGGSVIQAQEFNSLIDGATPLVRTVAKHIEGLDGTVGDLRRAINDGEISSRQFFDAMLRGLPDLQAQFDKTSPRITDALVQIGNSTNFLIGRLDAASGASAALTGYLQGLSGAIDTGSVNELSRALGYLDEVVLLLIGRFSAGAVASAFKGLRDGFGAISTKAAGAAGGMKVVAGASAALKGALTLVGGPYGAAILAGLAIARMGANALEARSRLLLLPPSIEEVAEAVTKLTASEKDLLKSQIVGELTRVTKAIEDIRNSTAFDANADTPFQHRLEARIEQLQQERARLEKVLRELYRPRSALTPDPSPGSRGEPGDVGDPAAFQAALEVLRSQSDKIRAEYAARIEAIRQSTAEEVQVLKDRGLTVAEAIKRLEAQRDAELSKLAGQLSPDQRAFGGLVESLQSEEQQIRARYQAQVEVIRQATPAQIQALKDQGLSVADAIRQLGEQRDAALREAFEPSPHQQAVDRINEAVLSLAPPFEQAKAAAEAWRASELAVLDQSAADYDELADKVEYVYNQRIAQALAEDVERRRQAAEEVLANSTRWQDGVLRALDRYNDGATNAAKVAENATTRALNNMQGALDQFVQTGQLRFGDLARSILIDLTRIAAHRAFGSLFGGLFGGGGTGSLIAAQTGFAGGVGGVLSGAEFALFHSGGLVGGAAPQRRRVAPAAFIGARRYHAGGLAGDEVPAILRRGEEVLPSNHPRHRNNGGGGSVRIEIINEGAPQQVTHAGTQTDMEGMVIRIVTEDIQRGGRIPNTMQRTFPQLKRTGTV